MKKLLLLSTVVIGLASGTANAGLVDCVSCNDYVLPSDFNPGWSPAVIPSGTTIKVATSDNQGLYLNHLADLTFEYLGKEAGFTNQFGFDSSVLFITGGSGSEDGSGGIKYAGDVADGWLKFFFQQKDPSASAVTNGDVNSPGRKKSSIGFYLESESLDKKFISWLLFFNDNGDDKDFDDMVVRLTATYDDGGNSTTPVPLPATLPLLGAGLAGLGVLKRMRARSTKRD